MNGDNSVEFAVSEDLDNVDIIKIMGFQIKQKKSRKTEKLQGHYLI